MRTGWAAVAIAVLVGGCAADRHRPSFHDDAEDIPAFSASHLGDPPDNDSVADLLLPEEREAVLRSGMTGVRVDPAGAVSHLDDPPKTGISGALDKVGKVFVSLLGVALTVGAAVAPFLLF